MSRILSAIVDLPESGTGTGDRLPRKMLNLSTMREWVNGIVTAF